MKPKYGEPGWKRPVGKCANCGKGWGDHYNGPYCSYPNSKAALWKDPADRIETAPTPAGGTPIRKVPDWPLRCPRCQNANSAVLLFQSYDCKNGCYK